MNGMGEGAFYAEDGRGEGRGGTERNLRGLTEGEGFRAEAGDSDRVHKINRIGEGGRFAFRRPKRADVHAPTARVRPGQELSGPL